MIGLYGPDLEEPPASTEAELTPTEPIELTPALDRPVASRPAWRPDGTALYVTAASAGAAELPLEEPTAHLQPEPLPAAAELRRLSSLNEGLRARLNLAAPEPLRFESDPDVFVEGWLLRPPGAAEAGRLPLVVSLHGGPVAQSTRTGWGWWDGRTAASSPTT